MYARTAALALVLTAAALPAQTTFKILPAAAVTEGTTATPMVFGFGAGRIQQVFMAGAVAPNQAILAKLALRADGSYLTALTGRTLTGLKVSLGYTSVTAAGMSSTFASNRTGTQTQVFTGNLILPPQDARNRPFNIVIAHTPFIYDPLKGNLLLELELPGTPVPGPYTVDAHVQSPGTGSSTTFGVGGKLGGGAPQPRVQCEADYFLKPGRTAAAVVSAVTKNYPTGILWGVDVNAVGPVNLPFDLGPVGAPGNALYLAPLQVMTINLIKSGNTYIGRSALPIPNSPVVLGARVCSQFFFQDPTANALGVVFTEGLAMHLQAAAMHAQYVQTKDPLATTGSKGFSGESLVVRWEGVFR